MPIDYYEPYMPTQEMAPSPEEIEAMQQKLAEQERIAALEAERHREAMIKQAAINLAIEKEQLTQKQWQKAQESIREAEQRKIRELQAEAEQLKRDLKKATAEQKAAGEKTLFERAKERVTEFIWGPTQPTKTTEESITEKKKQLEQLTKQIEEEEEAFFKETCQKNEQAKRAEEIRTLTGYKLTAIETARKVQLEAEERECARIADTKNLAAQQHEWLAFMDYIRNNKAATKESNEWVTEQAIEKAISMLKVASRLPSVDIVHIEQTLKDTFPKALVDQQREKLEKLNIFINQSNFNTAINNFVK
jgi:hypothetical protein